MRLWLILILALCSPCFGQQKASEVIQSELIEAPESVAVGRLISIKLPADLPFTVEPTPANKLSFIDEETGKRAYLILEAKAPGYRITIDYAVVHPTDEEIEAAPWDDREKFKAWLKSQAGRADEIYRDEHFVRVGDGKDDEDKDEDEGDGDDKDEDEKQPAGPYWIIVLEESAERPPDLAVILNDADFLKSLSDAGHKWRVYDEDHADARQLASLTTHRPALIITTLSGQIVKTIPMPKTTQGIRDALKGGAK